MKLKDLQENIVDYRQFRFSKLNTSQFNHLWWLLFWPTFGILFALVEHWTDRNWTVVYSPLDDVIPFCEFFMIPYMWWFVFLCGMLLFTLLFDSEAFRRMMIFITITYGITILIYLIFPTSQELRPGEFARDNFLTRFVADFYDFDTNTNVCPSIHVIGSVAVLVTSWNSKFFRSVPWQIYHWVATVLICLSTVFLKQHSVLDIPPALLLCVIAYPIAFGKKKRKNRSSGDAAAVRE